MLSVAPMRDEIVVQDRYALHVEQRERQRHARYASLGSRLFRIGKLDDVRGQFLCSVRSEYTEADSELRLSSKRDTVEDQGR